MSLDNVELDNLQAGDDVATDLISTDHYQMVKLTYGALGTANVVTSTATNPFPVALSDTDNAVLDAIETTLNSIETAVGGTHVDDAAFTPGSDDGVPIFAAFDDTTPDSVDEGDAGILRMSANRNLYNTIRDAAGNERGANVNAGGQLEVASSGGATSAATAFDSYGQVAINLTTGANQVLVSSAASKQIWVYGYTFTCGDADGQTVSFQDEDDTALSGIMEFSQYGGAAIAPSGNFEMPIWKLATDKDLEIDITGGDVDGWLSYAIVSV